MTTQANPSPSRRRLLLASDRSDQSNELAGILKSIGEVDTISTLEIPDAPADHISGIVVDINLRSAESVQQVRNKLQAEAYRSMPRLFVLADALHHGSMQAWALGATDTISRPFDSESILQRIHAAFPDSHGLDITPATEALNNGVAAAHAAMLHCGARGYVANGAAQRRLREAYFVAIVTPAIKQLKKMLADMK